MPLLAAHRDAPRRFSAPRLCFAIALLAAAFVLYVSWSGDKLNASAVAGLARSSTSSGQAASKSASYDAIIEPTTEKRDSASMAATAAATSIFGNLFGTKTVTRSICSDSCPHARDGVCQEGRPAPQTNDDGGGPYEVSCDLGTDCSDCGPWEYLGPQEALQWTPVADLRNKGAQLNVRRTATPVPFMMPYTDPSKDTDVSAFLADKALIEPGLTWVWHRLLKHGCGLGSNGEPGLVLDVGANFGYYSLLSAAMGCRVIAWEPVPLFSAFFKYGLLLNGFTNKVEVRELVVSDQHHDVATMVVPSTGIWGTAGVDGINLSGQQRAAGVERITKKTERLDKAIQPQDVLIMKVDVEGFEPAVLASAKELLLDGNIKNIVMEYSPGVGEAHEDWTLTKSNPARLLGLTSAGYTILHMNETFRVLGGFDWNGALPPMPQILPDALRHDIEDATRAAEGMLGCPLPSQVTAFEGIWWNCPGPWMTEKLSPKGFRSTFGYNTNIWASRDAQSPAKRGPPAQLMPPDAAYDVVEWFLPGKITYPHYPGHAMRKCADEPAKYKVKFRCHCDDAEECAALEQAVTLASQKGLMPPLPLTNATCIQDFDIAAW